MPVKRPQLENNEIYHVILRGVGDSEIFRDDNDRWRAIFSIYEFNTSKPVEIREQRKKRNNTQTTETAGGLSSGSLGSCGRDLLVDILAFCFMPNHIHLLVRQKTDEGITQFMRKFGTGYASYFNKKYERKGHLFQGRFRAIHIGSDEQLKTVFVYIHTNPISLIDFRWKKEGTQDTQKAIDFLKNYKWSSFPDYIGVQNFSSITERNFLTDVIGGQDGCWEIVTSWIKGKNMDFGDVAIE